MANRRMFSKDITNSSEFQMMSPSAQSLYFHIGMNSDDDGFCEVFTIVRMTESKPDDLRSLHERGLVYLVDSKVGIVKDWHTNNDIRSDRYTRSKYLDESKYSDVYMAIMQDKIKHLSRYNDTTPVLNSGITLGITDGMTQVRLGKDRIDNTNTHRIVEEVSEEGKQKKPRKNLNGFETFWELYPNQTDKVRASVVWGNLPPDDREKAIADLPERVQTEMWTKDDGKYIPLPKTYLEFRRWEDTIKKATKTMKF